MKITTRITLGYGLFIVILLAMAVYQVFTIERMQSINETLQESKFQNALICLEALRDLDLIDEYTRKSFASSDPIYLKQLKDFQRYFETRLIRLRNSAVSEEEHAEIVRLGRFWNSVGLQLRELQQNPPAAGATLPASLPNEVDRIRAQTRSVYESILRSMSSEVENSRRTGEAAALIMACTVFVALSISILVSFIIYRSISRPLSHLTEGTRAIAEGKFYYRLDTSRNDEFSQLAKDFNTMTRQLNELDEMKKDFVSHVSHELKSPLVSMQETIQLMLGGIPGPLTDKQRRLLDLNLQSGHRLTSMIGNLLDLSRIEAGVIEYEMQRRNLIPLVQSAIAEIEVQAHERGIHLETTLPDEELPVECDQGRMMQVIVNLVGNAVKFSAKGGRVRIDVERTNEFPPGIPEKLRNPMLMKGNGRFCGLVTVTDYGPGIADSDKIKIFQKFHQVRRDNKIPAQGVGLGLAISRTIVEAHGGAIWVEDNPGGGSRFRLLLRCGNTSKVEANPFVGLRQSDVQ